MFLIAALIVLFAPEAQVAVEAFWNAHPFVTIVIVLLLLTER